MNRISSKLYFTYILILIGILLLTSCGFPSSNGGNESATPNITQAYETVNAKLTMTLAVAQTQTFTVEASPSKSSTATPTVTEVKSTATNTATQSQNTPSPT
jgi:hypothetical protein